MAKAFESLTRFIFSGEEEAIDSEETYVSRLRIFQPEFLPPIYIHPNYLKYIYRLKSFQI
jgi:hypothetical protein